MPAIQKWLCPSCKESIEHTETVKEKIKGVGSKHAKKCIESQKSISGWSVPVLDGRHCCPYSYRSCMYSNTTGIEAVRNHCKSGNCLGPLPDDTTEKVYSNSPTDYTPSTLGK